MPQVKINGVTYDFDALDDDVKKHLKYLSFIDGEAERMSMQMNTLRLAREQIVRMLDLAMTRYAAGNSMAAKTQDAPGAAGPVV